MTCFYVEGRGEIDISSVYCDELIKKKEKDVYFDEGKV